MANTPKEMNSLRRSARLSSSKRQQTLIASLDPPPEPKRTVLKRSSTKSSHGHLHSTSSIQPSPLLPLRPLDKEPQGISRYHEQYFWSKGYPKVIGVDEAGRGPLAGPVVAAACIVPHDVNIVGIDDSKKLTMEQREKLYSFITTHPSITWSMYAEIYIFFTFPRKSPTKKRSIHSYLVYYAEKKWMWKQ